MEHGALKAVVIWCRITIWSLSNEPLFTADVGDILGMNQATRLTGFTHVNELHRTVVLRHFGRFAVNVHCCSDWIEKHPILENCDLTRKVFFNSKNGWEKNDNNPSCFPFFQIRWIPRCPPCTPCQ